MPTTAADATRAPEPTPRRPSLAAAARRAPGVVAVLAVAIGCLVLAGRVPALSALILAIAVGALARNLRLVPRALEAGLTWSSRRLLRAGVVLLGLQLALPQLAALGLGGLAVVALTVVVTFTGTRLLGRLLGVSPARSLLVATGFSICGASAVAAMEEVADGDEQDTAVAIALVTLCGSLAILLLPALRGPLGLDPTAFGSWVGASVHDVGQTVATADRVPGALTAAVVVKLSRVTLLAPLVAGVALRRHRTAAATTVGGLRPPVVPLFVAGFLAAIALRSSGLVPAQVLGAAGVLQQVLLAAALVGLGTGIHLPTLRRTGGQALLLGLASWLLVGAVSYGGVRLLAA